LIPTPDALPYTLFRAISQQRKNDGERWFGGWGNIHEVVAGELEFGGRVDVLHQELRARALLVRRKSDFGWLVPGPEKKSYSQNLAKTNTSKIS
jgi:hypothetical protein